MDATIAKYEQDLMQPARIVGIGKEINIARGAYHLVRSRGQAANQRRLQCNSRECLQCLLDLLDEPGHDLHIPSILATHIIKRMTDLAE